MTMLLETTNYKHGENTREINLEKTGNFWSQDGWAGILHNF